MVPAAYFGSMKGGGKIIYNIQHASKPPRFCSSTAVYNKSIF